MNIKMGCQSSDQLLCPIHLRLTTPGHHLMLSSNLSNDSFQPFLHSSCISLGTPSWVKCSFVAPSASFNSKVISNSFGHLPGKPCSDAFLILPFESEKLSVTTNFLFGINSFTVPVDQYSFPSGPRMQFKYLPPFFASIELWGHVNPFG